MKKLILFLSALILLSSPAIFASSLSQAEAEKIARKAIELVQQGNYKEVYYNLSTEELRKTSPYSSLVQIFDPIKSLGKVKNIKLSAIEFSDKGDAADLKYNVTYNKGSAIVSFTIKKKGATAQILYIKYNSDVLEKAFQAKIKEADKFVGKIIEMSKEEKFKEIYNNYTTSEFKKATSFKNFQDIMKLINEKSAGRNYGLNHFRINGKISLEYVSGEKGQSLLLTFTLVKVNNNYKIQYLDFKF